MPRNYKPNPLGKRYRKYDNETIRLALENYKTDQNCSLASVAQKFNINKSVLYRHNRRFVKSQGGQNALDTETELHIVKYLNICSNWGYPLDTYDLRNMIKLYLDNKGVSHKRFKNNMPGRDFVTRFLKTYKDSISLRICQRIKKSRAQVSPETIKEYFQELEESLKDIDPKNIVNYDEINLSDDPECKEVIVKRATKYPERVLNQSNSTISIMMTGTAAGELLPPYVIYKASNIYDTWTTSGPKGTCYNRTASGWIDGSSFEDYIKSIIIPFFKDKPGKKLMIGDNLSSHLSIEVIRICEEQNILFVFLPANSTHLTQPLDIAFFRPMKIAWRNILLRWKKTDDRNQATVPKGCFPSLLKLLINDLEENMESNLKAGFQKAGIIPHDRDEVLSRLLNDDEDPDKARYAVDKSVLDILKKKRHGTMNIKEPSHKRKLNTKLKSNTTENKEIEFTDPENIVRSKSMTKNTNEISKYEPQKKDIKNYNMNKNRQSKMKLNENIKKIDINLLPVVCVKKSDVFNYQEIDCNIQEINTIDNLNKTYQDIKGFEKSNGESFSHKNSVHDWDNDLQQGDEELFILLLLH